jgi:hypothetical protein
MELTDFRVDDEQLVNQILWLYEWFKLNKMHLKIIKLV